MLSSNGEFCITGDLHLKNDLENTLEFLVKKTRMYEYVTRKEKPSKCVFQITPDGRYCIGMTWDKKEGWNEFPFDFDIPIIAAIISKHLEKQKLDYSCGGDGSFYAGYKAVNSDNSWLEEKNGIKNPHYCHIIFEPFTCYYAK